MVLDYESRIVGDSIGSWFRFEKSLITNGAIEGTYGARINCDAFGLIYSIVVYSRY